MFTFRNSNGYGTTAIRTRLCNGRACAMPRQRSRYNRRTYAFPSDFPQRLKSFQGRVRLSWSEIAHIHFEHSAYIPRGPHSGARLYAHDTECTYTVVVSAVGEFEANQTYRLRLDGHVGPGICRESGHGDYHDQHGVTAPAHPGRIAPADHREPGPVHTQGQAPTLTCRSRACRWSFGECRSTAASVAVKSTSERSLCCPTPCGPLRDTSNHRGDDEGAAAEGSHVTRLR